MDNGNILKQIGNTPLIKLKQASEFTGCNIYGKAEYFNPGESAGLMEGKSALGIVNLNNLEIRRIFF